MEVTIFPRYMCRLINKHGLDVISHKNQTAYTAENKLAAIYRVLENGEPVEVVAIDIGLTNSSILRQWIKSYIENGYNVVTKKKGRHSTRDKEKEDGRGAGEGECTPSRAAIEEDRRNRILKKMYALTLGEEKKKKNN